MFRISSVLLFAATALSPAIAQESSLPVFTDITTESGIDFVHSFGDDELSNIIETTGPGCGFFDYDGDDDLDAYIVNGCYIGKKGFSHPRGRHLEGKLTNRLYRNNGDGTFTDVTKESGTGDKGFGMACAAADIDNDGDLDLFVTNYGPNVLYRNDGDGTFTDITREAGVFDDRWGIGCTFLDIDRDGYVDLYVGNYLQFEPNYRLFYAPDHFPGPGSYLGDADILYKNNGDGTFTDVTEEAGVKFPDGRAMGVASGDYNNDGYMDIFVANDFMPNYFFENDGKGRFKEIALESGAGFGQMGDGVSAMGPDFGDVDRDGWMDILVPDMKYGALYYNLRDGMFDEKSVAMGIAHVLGQYTSWGGGFFDYDCDGYIDIFIANGDPHKIVAEEDVLFRNDRGKGFIDVSAKSGAYFNEQEYVGRGSAFGDIDDDGDMDILIANLAGPAKILRNDGGNRNNWLLVKTVGTRSNRCGIGARLIAKTGELSQIADVRAGSGYLSMYDLRAHFGLGESSRVDSLEIRWPSGTVQTLENVEANQILTVTEPEKEDTE
jgi:hypothetical protein